MGNQVGGQSGGQSRQSNGQSGGHTGTSDHAYAHRGEQYTGIARVEGWVEANYLIHARSYW